MILKKSVARRLHQMQLVVDTPGALRARLSGCYFETYRMVYRLAAMGLNPNTVIDIGANRGMFTLCVHRLYPGADIFAFEPLRECYTELSLLQQRIPSLRCYQMALGMEGSEAVMHRNRYNYSSSLLEMEDLHREAFPYTEETEPENVKIQSLDEVLDGIDLREPVLMKIDVQGYEGAVLRGANRSLSKVDFILCEMSMRPLYRGQTLFGDIHQFLVDQGYRFAGHVGELQHPHTTEVLQIDGLFLRQG